MHSPSDPLAASAQLVARLRPILARGQLHEAQACVEASWSSCQLIEWLECPEADVRKLSAFALSLIGRRNAVTPLGKALHDPDLMVSQMAENALWSIWFRSGSPQAVPLVKSACCLMASRDLHAAQQCLQKAVTLDPCYAEAHNQLAIAYYLQESYHESLEACQTAIARMPLHFGAIAGMGHCHASLGELTDAQHCYRRALSIHPRLEGIQASLKHLQQILNSSGDPL